MYAAFIEPFSVLWWKMSLSVLFIGVFVIVATLWLPKNIRRTFSKYLGIFFLVDIVFFEFVLYYKGSWDVSWALPLQYCTIMELCSAIALITRWQWIYELVVFLGMVGPIQALIAPALPYAEDYFVYDFYLSHAAPIFIPFFLTFVEKMRPRPNAWWKSSLGFSLFMMLVFCFDYGIEANYMFLMERPPVNHPLIDIGEWPHYLGLWFLILVGWSGMVNLFFWVLKKLTLRGSDCE